jgi:hypothetical protein
MSIKHFVFSAICIGFANIFVEWLFIGFLFHKYQALTPQTWRKESSKSYAYSSIISFLFGVLFTLFYFKIGTRYVIYGNVLSACKFGLLCFGCFALLLELGNAIYINYDRKFVAGKLLASLFSYLAAAIIACMFY